PKHLIARQVDLRIDSAAKMYDQPRVVKGHQRFAIEFSREPSEVIVERSSLAAGLLNDFVRDQGVQVWGLGRIEDRDRVERARLHEFRESSKHRLSLWNKPAQ